MRATRVTAARKCSWQPRNSFPAAARSSSGDRASSERKVQNSMNAEVNPALSASLKSTTYRKPGKQKKNGIFNKNLLQQIMYP